MAEVRGRYLERIEYQILGDGSLRPELETLIKSISMKGNIKLLGWETQEELHEI